MNRKKFEIYCNPYSKEIEYCWFSEEKKEWMEVSEESELSGEEYKNTTIQNKANDIVMEINNKYNTGNMGLDIIFNGTDDDFVNIENVVKNFFEECDIKCERGDKYICTAAEVAPKIEEIFSQMTEVLKKYSNKKIENEINRYYDAVNSTIPICVMGLYSSGKSAFINSLIGDEILPSSSDPTTAKNYKIIVDNKAEIRFEFNGEKIILSFEENKYQPNQTAEIDILFELQKIVSNDDNTSLVKHMYDALTIINDYDKEHKTECVSNLIEVSIPFKNSSLPINEYNFIIYDTPGSNSESNEEHKEVLREAFQGQTNGLPIFITAPDRMDETSNDKIIKMVNELGAALDISNTMIIVNKSDSNSVSELQKKRKKLRELKITNWKSTRIYFVSSIIGLGSKKEMLNEKIGWIDDDYNEIYEDKRERFLNSEDKLYKQLYQYNIMPQDRYEKYKEKVKSIKDKGNLIFCNSGIHCVEWEIAEFAKKYALYNKCQNARNYLDNAVEAVVKEIKEIKEDIKKIENDIKEEINIKTEDLMQKLENKSEKLIESYTKEYKNSMKKLRVSILSSNELNNEAKKIWKKWDSYEKTDKENRINHIDKDINELYNEFISKYFEKANKTLQDFWEEKSKRYKDECCKIITETDSLDNGQKSYLKSNILEINPFDFVASHLDMRKEGVITKKRIFWITWEKFNYNEAVKFYHKKLKTVIRDYNKEIVDDSLKDFKNWSESLASKLIRIMGKFNPELSDKNKQLETYDKEKNSLEENQQCIQEYNKQIKDLMDYREK